ncbi:MAG TPA: hypothetical protein DCO83_03940 [Mucilaginibacter sp.]|nr:hypothetical protein [Mucilaginibacter sp.]
MESNKAKWHSRLTIWVVCILFFELISGLVIYLVSFSVTAQALVIMHTAVGLVAVIPYIHLPNPALVNVSQKQAEPA